MKLAGKKILITGSEGYIGKRLQTKLIKDHLDTALDTECCDLKAGTDLLNYNSNSDLDIVYHLAAQAGAIPSMKDPINDARQNILGTIKAIQIANQKGAKLVYVTSGAAKGEPESPYGLSKKTGEEYVKMLCNNYVILRFSSIYGGKDKGVVDNFIRMEKPVIFGDGSAVRDFVHIDDIVECLLKAPFWKGRYYECGSGKGVSVSRIAKATGKEFYNQEDRDGEKQRAVLSNTTPNWKPKIDVIDYVKEKCNR